MIIDKDGDSFAITSMHLSIVAKILGIGEATFQSVVMKPKTGCPVSKAQAHEHQL
jgi:osmotically inducible protein OsmC